MYNKTKFKIRQHLRQGTFKDALRFFFYWSYWPFTAGPAATLKCTLSPSESPWEEAKF